MRVEELTELALALPLPERIALAAALWQSIDELPGADPSDEERATVGEAVRRDAELASGNAVGRTHPQVMEAARRVLDRG